MSKSRRDKFEDQLRALQSDINHLSHKLSVPAVHSIGAHSASETQVVHQKKSPKGGNEILCSFRKDILAVEDDYLN